MRRINIKNFGPIRSGRSDNEGWIDLNKVTVFIGNNGTGKSVIAKMVSTFSWMEKALFMGRVSERDLSTRGVLENYCRYHKIDGYFGPDTSIQYDGDAFSLKYENDQLYIHGRDMELELYQVPKIMYVGAERSFLSVAANPAKIKGLPDSLGTFLDEFESALERLDERTQLPFEGIELSYSYTRKTPVIHGLSNQYEISLSEASSGIQSATPLVVVSHYLANLVAGKGDPFKRQRSSEEEAQYRRSIEDIVDDPTFSPDMKKYLLRLLESRYNIALFFNIVEEPEQNLFPDAQQCLLYDLLECANQSRDNELIITTHSPYLISYLTFATKAGALREEMVRHEEETSPAAFVEAEKKLDKIVPLGAVLTPDQVSIYELDEQGRVHLLKQYEGLPSDNHYLNQRLRAMNEQFAQLLDLEMQVEEWQ